MAVAPLPGPSLSRESRPPSASARPESGVGRVEGGEGNQLGPQRLQVPDLPQGTPLQVGLARVADIGVGEGGDAALAPEPRRQLVGEADVLDEAVRARGQTLDRLDGIIAYSNGSDMGSGNNCAGVGGFGHQYQCVEFARRYWAYVHQRALPPVANANDLCTVPESG
ncbi:MAG TPA: hypothetical protein VFZ09_34155 [Archangium sp.]|uniref:hypothetical protein n=1 Tax=Archangium sp. TaxID=1872627 RepID=UPI002E3072D6|nr:hypothetical protein [Archangium sp.]HEX5751318.1 hypothetical protein [Archangium sp.]